MNQEEYLKRFVELSAYKIRLTAKKGSDYAGKQNVFHNFELIEYLTKGRISAADGILVRMTDKLQRFANLLEARPEVVEESIEDTLNDLSIYSDIAYLLKTRNKAPLFPDTTYTVQPEPDSIPTVDAPPEGASPNTAEDAFAMLVKQVEERGIESLSLTEREYLKMVISMKLGAGAADTLTEAA